MGAYAEAGILGGLFVKLSKEEPSQTRARIAEWAWKECAEHDFSDDEMECDAALTKLGLAKKCRCGSVNYRPRTSARFESQCEECNREVKW